MFLNKLKLTNFRNYSSLSLEFDKKPTIFLGNNGVGKTNILEAVYLLSTGKSQRVVEELEFIKQGEEFSNVQCTIENVQKEETKLEVAIQFMEGQFGKRVKVNGVARRVVDFIGNLPAVIFYPSDINMVTGAPSLRRWHLDLSLAQMDTNYKKSLTLYEQVVTNRNKVLKRIREGEGRVDELIFWNEELIKYGDTLVFARNAFLEFLSNLETPLGNFKFIYQKNELSDERLNHYQAREIAASATLIGPHRDDFKILLNERDIAKFGSRGEQRTATLAFKLGSLEYMAISLGKRPVLLLDDVFSELDAEHRAHVVEIVGKQQTLIVTVELENIPQEFLATARIIFCSNGKLNEIADK